MILLPDRPRSLAGISLAFNVGTLQEGPEQIGYAHLVEHLLFEPDAPEGGSLATDLAAAGSLSSATTTPQATCFLDVVPPSGLERALSLVPGRLRLPDDLVDQAARQMEIIKCEIAASDRPIELFPWPQLRAALLDRSSVIDAFRDATRQSRIDTQALSAFFSENYRLDEAVLTIAGEIDFERTEKVLATVLGPLVEDVGASDTRSHAAPPTPPACIRGTQSVAVGWLIPNVTTHPERAVIFQFVADYISAACRSAIDAGEVSWRAAGAFWGETGEPLEMVDPAILTLIIQPGSASSDDALNGEIDSILQLAERSCTAEQIAKSRRTLLFQYQRDIEAIGDFTVASAVYALKRRDPFAVYAWPRVISSLEACQVQAAVTEVRDALASMKDEPGVSRP